ncbi:uncharacterized protein LOC131639128 [Vicia villosa]|uniref:uncharacterized protein LOC131639128 n=1 Tax=Vicia villosa TaxID=3911 RepID=UPI00273BF50D|nr:uncharacterized protein LOC131639128 [Vicia villosa]
MTVTKNVALVAHTSLSPAKEDWYLDSGCSNHMTGRKNSLVDLKLEGNKYVTLESDESDESDEESYVRELTISELSAGFTETWLMNEKLCAKVREYRSINRFLLEERVSLMIDITDRERKLDKLTVSNDPKSLSESNVIENVTTTSEDIVKVKGSKRFGMSQQSSDGSPIYDSTTPEESSNPNRIMKVVPLRTINGDEVRVTKPKTTHGKWPKEGIRNKGTKPSASATMEELTKEGSKYVDSAITRIVTRILKENHQVLRIYIPLQTIMPDPLKNNSKTEATHIVCSDPIEEKINTDRQGIAENTNVTEDVNEIKNNEHPKANTETVTNVVDLDVYSDNELLTSLNPSVANRLMIIRKSKVVTKSTWVSPSKSWSKVIPQKRKEREIVEPESDVEVHVPEIPSSAIRMKYILQKRLAVERELAPNVLENKEVLELIQEAGILKTVCNLPKCYEKLVKEFVVNLSEDCGNSGSVDFRKVFVRGKCVSFSLSLINKFLERKDEAQTELEVTDNKVCQVIIAKQVNSWPLKEKLTTSKLSIKYAMLHKIGATNWVPTNHKSTIATVLGRFIYVVGTKAKFNYGTYIFEQTLKHAGSFIIKGPIAFPSFLCGIILDQYPNILNEHDIMCKRESPLSFHYKLLQGKHVPNVVMTSAETSKSGASARKSEIISMLKETCKELEYRKTTLEKLISTMEMEEHEEFADTEEMEDRDEQEVEEESASPADGSEKESSADTSSGSESGE